MSRLSLQRNLNRSEKQIWQFLAFQQQPWPFFPIRSSENRFSFSFLFLKVETRPVNFSKWYIRQRVWDKWFHCFIMTQTSIQMSPLHFLRIEHYQKISTSQIIYVHFWKDIFSVSNEAFQPFGNQQFIFVSNYFKSNVYSWQDRRCGKI